MKTIYELDLHEPLIKGSWIIIRVAGGWVYYRTDTVAGGKTSTGVFVPYNEEFKPADSI